MWFAFGKSQMHTELVINLKLQTGPCDLCGNARKCNSVRVIAVMINLSPWTHTNFNTFLHTGPHTLFTITLYILSTKAINVLFNIYKHVSKMYKNSRMDL